MTFPLDPHADPLHDWLEARAAGQVPPDAPGADADLTDLFATADQLDHLANRYEDVVLQTRTPRHHSWEEHMRAATATSMPDIGHQLVPAPQTSTAWRTRVQHWQAYMSFGLILAVTLSLMAITYDRVNAPPTLPTPTGAGNLPGLAQGDATAATWENACVPRDIVWQEPEKPLSPDRSSRYVAVERAPDDIGQLALDSYVAFWACMVAVDPALPDTVHIEREVALASYFTTDGAVLLQDDYLPVLSEGDPLGAEFAADAPIALNRPATIYRYPGTTLSTEAFEPADVFRFFDGRYGVVFGLATTEGLRHGADSLNGGYNVTFVSFVEQDGQLFIDEFVWVTLCEAAWTNGTDLVDAGATPEAGAQYACQ